MYRNYLVEFYLCLVALVEKCNSHLCHRLFHGSHGHLHPAKGQKRDPALKIKDLVLTQRMCQR